MSVCTKCDRKCEEVTVDYDYQGVTLHGVKALRCTNCKEQMFTLEQYDAIRRQINKIEKPYF